MSSLRAPSSRYRTPLLGLCVATLLIVLLECTVGNLGFWSSLSASTDTASHLNTTGSGLLRQANGSYRVTDPTQAYFEVDADGSSPYVRVDLVSEQSHTRQSSHTADQIHLQVDGQGSSARAHPVYRGSNASRYLRVGTVAKLRIWVQESQGSVVPISAIRANVHAPFHFSWSRVAVLIAMMLAVCTFRPQSRLWSIRLDTHSARQRRAFLMLLLPVLLGMTIASAVTAGHAGQSVWFHTAGNYTYDFDQYGRVADALLHGHAWVDLPVPEALADSADPYSTQTRQQLLDAGVSPLFWDYAFYQGHWYSYFGVLPAVALFMPYRLITSLWIPGGAMLPSSAAVILLLAGFTVFGSLLVIRLLERLSERVSLATAALAVLLVMLGANAGYLWFRQNFYSIPFAASLLLSSAGLWLWLGARSRQGSDSHGRLSLPHLAGGTACIAANFGCRPTFCLLALLAIPLFWGQITGWLRSLTAIILPALVVIAPLGWYNMVRFNSPLDFGSRYQLTVTDMTSYREPLANMLPMIGDYLFLPLRAIGNFPFLGISPTPLPQWGYTEPMMGGFFVLCPLALGALALPWMGSHIRDRRLFWMLCCAAGIGMGIVVLDVAIAGLGWRYFTDFGWLLSLSALPCLVRMLGEHDHGPLMAAGIDADDKLHGGRRELAVHTMRVLVVVILAASLIIAVLGMFIVGREDPLVRNDPGMFYLVRSWFSSIPD